MLARVMFQDFFIENVLLVILSGIMFNTNKHADDKMQNQNSLKVMRQDFFNRYMQS